MALILLVEDEHLLRWALKRRLESRGHIVHEAGDLAEARVHVTQHKPEVIVLDINLPDGNGLDFLAQNREFTSESAVMVVTAVGQIEDAVRAMKLGAHDFLTKPLDQNELLTLVDEAVARQRDTQEAEGYRRSREGLTKVKIIAESPVMQEVLKMALGVAGSNATTILIQSETGTGKEVLARYIHANSLRGDAPFLALNCAALPEHLVESELFGHEKGAFTDAKGTRKGIFELANGGTVVLDEIGELPLGLQAKLLRFLEDRTFRRIGAAREIFVDVRVIALTNRRLEDRAASGEFRRDLFYRLNVFPIHIPPLRERRQDIVPLAEHFVGLLNEKLGRRVGGIAREAGERLASYDWPGNVRELRNVIERAMILEQGPRLELALFTGKAAFPVPAPATAPGSLDAQPAVALGLDEMEKQAIERAMRQSGGNQSRAARLLKITRDRLRYKLKKHCLQEGVE